MPTMGEDESEESEGIWQTIPTSNVNKRRLIKSPNIHQHKKFNFGDEPSTSKENRFILLDDQKDDEDINVSEVTAPKPPPIYIPNVTSIIKMLKDINSDVPSSDFSYKSMNDNQIRLMVKNVNSYRKVIKLLDAKKISFHTYQLKQERAYRIVVKGIHHSTPTEDIKAELLLLGHQVRAVVNVKSRVTKLPLPMFFVDLDPNYNNKDVYNIKSINNAMVSIEPPKKVDDLVQCYRCQQFGHTKTYCKKPFKCVKCGLDHQTTLCTTNFDIPPKCVNCLQTHTASYKGCKIYQELLEKKEVQAPET